MQKQILDEKEVRRREIEWYRKHGKYPERIKQGRINYVIGDHSWNLKNPDKYEVVEQRMDWAGIYGDRQLD